MTPAALQFQGSHLRRFAVGPGFVESPRPTAAQPKPAPPTFKPGDTVRLGLYFVEVVSYSPKARRVRYRKLSREKLRAQHMLRSVFEKTAVPA